MQNDSFDADDQPADPAPRGVRESEPGAGDALIDQQSPAAGIAQRRMGDQNLRRRKAAGIPLRLSHARAEERDLKPDRLAAWFVFCVIVGILAATSARSMCSDCSFPA